MVVHPDPILLEENFSDELDSNWSKNSDNQLFVDTTNGVLTLDAENMSKTSRVWYKGSDAATWTNYDVCAKVLSPSANGCSYHIAFRVSADGSTYYSMQVLNGSVYITKNGSRISGVGGSTGVAKDGQVHDVKITVRGNTFQVFMDGVSKATWTDPDASYATGGIGFTAQNYEITFDDVKVYQAD